MCSPFYLISLLVICAVAGQGISVIILDYFFFHSEKKKTERKLTNRCTCIAVFLKATKCIAFHSGRLDVSIVSIVSQLPYGSSRLRSAKTPFRDWSVSRSHIANPRSYNIQRQQRYLKRSVLRCFWLLQSLFCLKRSCSGVFAFIYKNESKLLKTVFKTYGNIYTMKQFK